MAAVKGYAVTSALACVGLSVSDETDLNALVTSAYRAVRETGVYGGVHVGRWQDASGAVLILGWCAGELVDFVPAYAAASGGLLSDCRLINDSVAFAKIVDADGQQVTAMAFEAEQYRQLRAFGHRVSGPPGSPHSASTSKSTPMRTPSPPRPAANSTRRPAPPPDRRRTTASPAGPGRRGWPPSRSSPTACSPTLPR